MTNGDSSRHNGNDNQGDPTTRQKNYNPSPAPSPPVHGYPNYGYNTQNPPTNLWGGGADIAAMAIGHQQIPSNVVIANNFSDTGSLVSAFSNPTQVMASSATLSNPNNVSKYQKPLQQQLLQQQPPTNIQQNQNRAIHRINLSSIRHNYYEVQSSAAQQQCQVIVVVKADGYGHGAILSACHLVEHCDATAFAVATIEEGTTLRRAFEEKFPNSSRVRILVLGAPVGYPNCFDTYLHNSIELMVSGPEVAASLAEWMINHDGRRRAEVERVGERRKEELMDEAVLGDYRNPMRNGVVRQISTGRGEVNEELLNGKEGMMHVAPSKNAGDDAKTAMTCNTTVTSNDAFSEESFGTPSTPVVQEAQNGSYGNPPPVSPSRLQTKYNAATLTNVTGDDLAREVRQILVSQRHATAKALQTAVKGNAMATIPEPAEESNGAPAKEIGLGPKKEKPANNATIPTTTASTAIPPARKVQGEALFCGIEDAARASRQRELRAIKLSQVGDEIGSTVETMQNISDGHNGPPQIRKKLRWHALVDSGMGRLGFKTESDEHDLKDPQCRLEIIGTNHVEDALSDGSISSSGHSGIKDTVAIIKELYDAEVYEGAPIEFYGMCTHMADANSNSTYTHDQMERFRSLLHRVRSEGIAVPSISTDNSAALLTPSLTHFKPNAILAHDTRGYVRCGGAIYGQRPAFRQLRAVSTLSATVKHVAIIKKGESVGYDRAYVAPMDVMIATLTVGFADGYPRELGNGVGKVSIRGSIFPVAGNVCMDMLMVDLGPADDSAGAGSTIEVGDTAVLWGPDVDECGDGLVPLAKLAATLKTTQSALTCGLDKLRVQRQLVG